MAEPEPTNTTAAPVQRRWYSTREIAAHIGTSITAVAYRLVPAGMPHTRIGVRYYFDPDLVDQWLRTQPGDSIDATLERLHQEWLAGGGSIDDKTAARIAEVLAPARRRRLEREQADGS
jgi:hypothetical protein